MHYRGKKKERKEGRMVGRKEDRKEETSDEKGSGWSSVKIIVILTKTSQDVTMLIRGLDSDISIKIPIKCKEEFCHTC